MKKFQLMFTALVLALSLAAFGQSSPDTQSGQGQHHGRGQGRGPGMNADAQLEHMSSALNLTDDQKAKIKPILEEQSNKMHQLMQDTSVSQQDKRSKFQQIHQDTMSQIKPILTSDQQQKLESMHERGGEGHGQHGQGSQTNPQ
jgi:Spy/CpxP family protein refolding chaperone